MPADMRSATSITVVHDSAAQVAGNFLMVEMDEEEQEQEEEQEEQEEQEEEQKQQQQQEQQQQQQQHHHITPHLSASRAA